MEQLLLHLIGDYITQSHWMATNKTKASMPCLIHVVLYSAGFLLLRPSLAAFAVIAVTHFFIDRFRLARFVVFAKNWAGCPIFADLSWNDCSATGFASDVPPWLAVWLLIVVDNTLHLSINYAALRWL